MTEDVFYRKEIYFIEIAEIKYGWVFISLKRPKFGRTGDLFH